MDVIDIQVSCIMTTTMVYVHGKTEIDLLVGVLACVFLLTSNCLQMNKDFACIDRGTAKLRRG
jgi:hypothetical protein